MTRLAVLADIHGNLPALEAVIADMAQFGVDHVIVAGDSISIGPDSAAVVAGSPGWVMLSSSAFAKHCRAVPSVPVRSNGA